MLRTTACWKELPTTRHPLACISQRIGRVLTFPDGSGTARKIWHGYRSPVSSPDSSQTTRTKPKKRRETEHSQMAPPPMLGMYAHTCYAHRLVIVRGMQRRNLTKSTRSMLRRRVQRNRRCSPQRHRCLSRRPTWHIISGSQGRSKLLRSRTVLRGTFHRLREQG